MKSAHKLPIIALLLVQTACSEDLFGKIDFSEPPASPATLEHVNVDSVFARGLRDLADGDAEAAQESFSKVLTIKPTHKDASLGLAESHLALGNANQSLELFRQLQDDDEHRAAALQGQGLSYHRLGDFNLAKRTLSAAVDADQSQWRAWNALGQIYDSEQAWEQSSNAYIFGISQNPNSIAIRNNMGMSLLMQDKPDEALPHFETALNIKPGNETATINRQIALAKLGRYAEALEGISQKERYIALNNIGYIAMTKGELKRARHYFNLAAEESPSYYELAEENLKKVDQMLANETEGEF